MSSDLQILNNSPETIVLGGKKYKISTPTLKILAEVETYGKELKQNKRKDYIKQYIELLGTLPKDMSQEEKKEFLKTILPGELTPKDKLDLLAAMPDTWTDEKKNFQMNKFLLEREGIEWMETLYLLWLCIKVNHPEVQLEEIRSIVTTNDIDVIIKAVTPKKLGVSEKNV